MHKYIYKYDMICYDIQYNFFENVSVLIGRFVVVQ
jgi:hypothetical protein